MIPEYNFTDLGAPFPALDIEWRIQRSGEKNDKIWAMVLAYVTNRAIMERLDTVIGPENWCNHFKDGPQGGLLCGLSLWIRDGWVTKWDGADNTQVEAVKGGLSGSMKRAGVQWNIGRYLYKLPAGFANISDKGEHRAKLKEGNEWFKWDAPQLPAWALPSGESPVKEISTPVSATPEQGKVDASLTEIPDPTKKADTMDKPGKVASDQDNKTQQQTPTAHTKKADTMMQEVKNVKNETELDEILKRENFRADYKILSEEFKQMILACIDNRKMQLTITTPLRT